jgi:NAD(P)-dependent dehydrogenase (short-subunit alcohol dehydrogenase family)
MTAGIAAGALTGRRALVTGGTRGLGAAIATGLAQAGADVVVAARRPPEGTAHPGTSYEEFDLAVGSPAVLVDRAESRLGGWLDIVVHSAGIQRRAPAVDFVPEDWDEVLAVNLTAPFRLSQEIAKRQIERGMAGRHVFIASLAARLGLPGIVAYNAAKSGLLGVVRALALEWAPHGITVNAIGPGYVHTDLTDAVFADPERRQSLLRRIPMGRFGQPLDIAGPAVFLTTDSAAYITGQLLMVDGGWTAA